VTQWLRCAPEGPRPTRRDHSKSTALSTLVSTEREHYTGGRAPSRRWSESQGGASEPVPSPNGAPKRAPLHATARARNGPRRDRTLAARRARRAGCGSCARVSARAQSADEYEPSRAHWLPQQPTQSRLKGWQTGTRSCAEQGHARGRDTGFEGSKPAAHLSKPSKTPNSLVTQGGNEPPTNPASWVASHQGRVRIMVMISAVQSRRPTVCEQCAGRDRAMRARIASHAVRALL
jgi:hypothetical protein